MSLFVGVIGVSPMVGILSAMWGVKVEVMDAGMTGLVSGLGAGTTQALVGGWLAAGFAGNAWSWSLIARWWLALLRRLPWRLMTFLEDAHRRGLLRRTGAIYQFRHIRLQDRLVQVVDERQRTRHNGAAPPDSRQKRMFRPGRQLSLPVDSRDP